MTPMILLPKSVLSTERETCISDYPKLCHLDRSTAKPSEAERPLYFVR